MASKSTTTTSNAPAQTTFTDVRASSARGGRTTSIRSRSTPEATTPGDASDRCFYCKSELYEIAERKQRQWGLAHVLNGTNLDDLGDHRPGLEAAKNANVRSVLVECGFHKDDVRAAAHTMGLAIWDKPASACLSSRIPYGTEVTRERLAQIGGLEAELRLVGLRQVRVRWHALGGPASDRALARVEVARGELAAAFDARDAIVEAAKRFGFAYTTLDLHGYRMGSHNEVLVTGKSLRVL